MLIFLVVYKTDFMHVFSTFSSPQCLNLPFPADESTIAVISASWFIYGLFTVTQWCSRRGTRGNAVTPNMFWERRFPK